MRRSASLRRSSPRSSSPRPHWDGPHWDVPRSAGLGSAGPVPASRGSDRSRSLGFTLIELMVALTGGLMFSAFVFMLAKDTTRFYQNELRLSAATQNVVTGFQRLRTDIARAGFLSTPNVRLDPSTCVNLGDAAFTGTALGGLATLRIDTAAGANRHTIELMGSYASADTFPVRAIMEGGGGTQVVLQPQSGAFVRLVGQILNPTQAQLNAALNTVFLPGRVLRIVDKAGAQQFAVITSVNTDNPLQPFIQLGNVPQVRWKANAATPCGLRGQEAGSLVNVVQRIRYSLQALTAADPDFAPLFGGLQAAGTRLDLIRTELDWGAGTNQLANTPRELVAEHAVGLHFNLTRALSSENFRATPVAEADVATVAGDPIAGARPQHIRSVHALLAVRSSAPDRGADLLGDANASVAPGIYRVQVNPGETPARFARVRTLQADIALRNQRNARW